MRPSDAARALAALLTTKRPAYLWGPPGAGKSSVVRAVAAGLGLALVDVRATLLDPVDLRGLPRLDGDAATWCPPARSWQFASDVLAATPDDLAHAVVAGCVGEGPAAEFAAFRQLYRELPDVDAALTAPDATPVPREPAVLYALVGALVEKCRAG